MEKPIIHMQVNDGADLHNAYMPFITDGGALYVPTKQRMKMGQHVIVTLEIKSMQKKIPILGKVVWIGAEGAGQRDGANAGVQLIGENRYKVKKAILSLIGDNANEVSLYRTF